MPDDDEILRAYEEELSRPERSRPRSNRGFWLVAGAMLVAGIVLVVEIVANRDIKDSIAHSQSSLRAGQAAAEAIEEATGSFASATPDVLEADRPLTFVGPDEPSGGPDEVSVAATATEWGAAVQARPGACFYLHLAVGGDPRYGYGTECTGTAALDAIDPRW